MLTGILKMILGVEENPKEDKAAPKKESKDIIHPFPNAPVKIDFISCGLKGRCCPEYVAAPGGRIFATEEEDILIKAMFDACIRYYNYPITKSTIDSFEAFVVQKCREKSVKETTVKKYNTLQEQLNELNIRVEDTFARNHPNHMYRHNPDREYLNICRVYERNQAYKEFAKKLEMKKELREKEYEKYRSIWY